MPTEYTNFFVNLAQQTGHTPAVMQLTYEVPPTNVQAAVMNPFAISHWQAGGLVLVHYAPPNPVSNGHPGDLTNVVNLTTLFTPGTATHTNWMRSLDLCADGLQQLRDAGVVVLFTILHENNGSWLWWHKHPRTDYVALYRGVHDYFTRVRGLNNLLWIFHPSEATHDLLPMDYYYPGDDVVDVVGPSVYNSTFQFPFPMDDLFRAYPKAFGLTEANANVNTNVPERRGPAHALLARGQHERGGAAQRSAHRQPRRRGLAHLPADEPEPPPSRPRVRRGLGRRHAGLFDEPRPLDCRDERRAVMAARDRQWNERLPRAPRAVNCPKSFRAARPPAAAQELSDSQTYAWSSSITLRVES
ncbi:MAG: mannan endo-1 4-beta-mannosidase [Limisphaerales bacterium]|nr:MAG: mannan endo-1 4-beta-mannosidase [Limisphaerales bacterium]